MFRQAMASSLVRLEVLPVSSKLQYEKSLISQIFSGFDSAHTAVPKPKSPFMLRKVEVKPSDPAPSSASSWTPPPKEEPAVRRSPIVVERREQTPPPPVSASPTPRSRSESPASTVNPAFIALANANKKSGRKMINLTKGDPRVSPSVCSHILSVCVVFLSFFFLRLSFLFFTHLFSLL